MRAFVVGRPVLSAIIVMAILQAIVAGGLLVSHLAGVPILALDLPILLVNALVAAALLSALRWWRAAGFNGPSNWRDLRLLILPLALLLGPTMLLQPRLPDTNTIAVLIVVTLLIGFQEEAIFRGLLLRLLAPRGLTQAVLISAFLFGIIHVNSLFVGRDPLFVASQVLASFLGAIGLGALRVRLNTIWPLVGMHALNGFLQFSATGGLAAGEVALFIPFVKIAIAGALALYGVYLLREEGKARAKAAPREAVAV